MTVAQLLAELHSDEWRARQGFSPEMAAATDAMLSSKDEAEVQRHLRDWLLRHQPCLFGRIAAAQDLISFCILRDDDLRCSDTHISRRIQQARLAWTREGFYGRKSAFVIAAVSERITHATPDAALLALAERLASLYLQIDVRPNTIYLDELFLEMPATRTTWRWNVGVNFFGSQGDGRWWRDHRFPGGLAFSMNSVGHLARSGRLTDTMRIVESAMGLPPPQGWFDPKVKSLEDALVLAMRTIHMAAESVSGKATWLLPRPDDTSSVHPECPVELPAAVASFNHCEYAGYYHTDETLPAEYFRPDVERPPDTAERRLDFTYLFHTALENPDFITTGDGRQVRAPTQPAPIEMQSRQPRMVPEVCAIESMSRLVAALRS